MISTIIAVVTVTIAATDEGWFAARIEGTGAFGQGRMRDEALRDVLIALRDLERRPSPATRVLYGLRSRLADLRDLLLC